ncbi:MAG: polyprenyl synthetase family protein [Bacteroidales bacterium]|nr:polyprenyl synthetase family protein [Bacteroidales bacterium]MCF8343982.1 polyprenyl synthetase family protein [Bacteroidales bacterium]MCF8351113.1 polyprenyl synthetase family protein [Bacteroidales bacterium]MCF8376964.1 polyprenyl synthetase family protein [Bacteroidales bacterium]MCF8401306.1 polyprenyl synthetase family protein [Bacteroidales bacterium]
MHSITELQQIFIKKLEQEKFSGNPSELYRPISYILDLGGKRMRPVLLLMGCELFGGKPGDALDASMGIEIFHNFTLVHDDIMDKAPIRRGAPTIHQKWNDNIAILSGDTMFALAYKYLQSLKPEHLKPAFEVFTQTAIEVCEGQQFDMNFEKQQDVCLDQYLEMIRLKTAVLLGASLKIGAIIANAGQEELEKLYQFGVNLGLAFQLRDDLLDLYSDEKEFGKQTGGDVMAGKKTYLFLKAVEVAGTQTGKELHKIYLESAPDLKHKLVRVKEIFDSLKIRSLTEEKIMAFSSEAIRQLDNIEVENSKKSELKKFAEKLRNRTF